MSPTATTRRAAGNRQRGATALPATDAVVAPSGSPPATTVEGGRCAARPPSPPRPGATGAGLAVVMGDGGLAAIRGGGDTAWRDREVAAAWRVDGWRPPRVGWPAAKGGRRGRADDLVVAFDRGLGGISGGGCGASRCGGGAKKHRGGMAVASRRGGMASVCAGGVTTECAGGAPTECAGGDIPVGRATDAAAAVADVAGDAAADAVAAVGRPPAGGGVPLEAGGTPGDVVAVGAAVLCRRRCFGGRRRSSGSQRAVHRRSRPTRGRRATGGEVLHKDRPGATAKATASECGDGAVAAMAMGQAVDTAVRGGGSRIKKKKKRGGEREESAGG